MTAQDGAPETVLKIYKMKVSPHSPQVNFKYQLVSKIAAFGQIGPKCRAGMQKKFPLTSNGFVCASQNIFQTFGNEVLSVFSFPRC